MGIKYSKIAVIGSAGQLGSELVDIFGKLAMPLRHEDIEVKDVSSCRNALKDADAAINCAAYVAVDKCETNPEEAFAVNAVGAKNVAQACNERGITNVYISTDFVFDGKKRCPYTEEDAPNPINIYGLSKYAGEAITRNSCPKHYVIRASSIYGKTGSRGKSGNFVEWMLAKAASQERVEVVSDITMSPTYAKDAAAAIKGVLLGGLPFGTYHAANSGQCTWFEFAKKIFERSGIRTNVFPINSESLKREAKRPAFSALENKKLQSCGIVIRPWDAALEEYLKMKRG